MIKKYGLRKQIIDQRNKEYMELVGDRMKFNQKIEHNIVFDKGVDLMSSENVKAYTNVEFFSTDSNFQRKIPKVDSYIPDVPKVEMNPQIKLFSLLIDINCLFDTSDIYDKSWAVNYRKLIKYLNETGQRLIHLEVGDSFTTAITDDQKIYTWGLNDCFQ